MAEINETEKGEKKSISFIEQIIVNDLEKGLNGCRPVSHPSRTATST